jgi:hypothetical protein
MRQTDNEQVMNAGKTYILIIDRQGSVLPAGAERFTFKHFSHPSDVIPYVADMSRGGGKVHKIVQMDAMATDPVPMEIRFEGGKLVLVEVPVVGEYRRKLEEYESRELIIELSRRKSVDLFELGMPGLSDDSEMVIAVPGGEKKIEGPANVLVCYQY